MVNIPSITKTSDLIYRFEIQRGTRPADPACPNLLKFEGAVTAEGQFHSLDITVMRDGSPAEDVWFESFRHLGRSGVSWVEFSFLDPAHRIEDHDYLLTVILRYRQAAS
jgi:hypothetical protein